MTVFPRNPELEAALLEDPDDEASYVVYGDWLQQAGSPHGELIQLQRALAADPENAALREREASLLEHHGAELVGESVLGARGKLEWRAGFVWRAQLECDPLLELSRRPAGRLLREIEVDSEHTLQPVLDRLAELALPLQTLQLAIIAFDDDWFHVVGDLGRLWHAQPQLRRLVIEDGAIVLGAIASRSLRELVLQPTTLTPANLRSLAEATLPALTHLELWFEHEMVLFNDGWYDRWAGDPPRSTIGIDDVRPLLAATQLSSLRHLTISHATLGDALCEALVSSPLAARLQTIALTGGTITDVGAAVLAGHRAVFTQLERIDLDGNHIATDALLAGLPCDPRQWTQFPPRPGPRGP
jgi:uncharacterized protein (TIGR02996 family)